MTVMRYLRSVLGIALTLLLGAMLLATIYFTLFDLQWIAFLAGVLFAAVAASASQASKSQWLVMRRTRQLQRIKHLLADETARHARTAEALKAAESRFQRLGDALPAPQSAAQPIGAVNDTMAGSQQNGDTFYLESMNEQFISGSDPRALLMQALQEDRFMLYAQTIRPLSGTVPYQRCFEVLLRLQKANQDLLPPGGFFPVAERYNLMGEIDRWVVRNVIKWCLDKQRSDPAWQMPLYSVNLAAASLREPEFALYVRSELQRHTFPASKLCFEIAEQDVINYHGAVQAFMSTLRPLGCRFTLDAFGSTKVSFAPLKDLTLDFLKIDGVIIQNILTDPGNLAKIRAIATASRKIGIRTIAEWVESDDTVATLRKLGVDYAQGFGIGKLGPIAQVS